MTCAACGCVPGVRPNPDTMREGCPCKCHSGQGPARILEFRPKEKNRMRTLHMLHELEVGPGEETATVRNGTKWANLAEGEPLELCVCTRASDVFPETVETHQVVGTGEVTGLWVGPFSEVPARLIRNEHEERARAYDGLLASMRSAYGPDFGEDSRVTVVSYRRVS